MTVARSQLVDVHMTPWYHVISKTVRGAFLLGEERKKWLETRLEELTDAFAIDLPGFWLLESHLHWLLRLSPERAATWSEEEVVRRWGRLFPPRGKDRKPLAVSESWVQQKLADATFVQKARRRLADLTLVHEVPQRAPGPYGQSLGSSDRSLLAGTLPISRRS